VIDIGKGGIVRAKTGLRAVAAVIVALTAVPGAARAADPAPGSRVTVHADQGLGVLRPGAVGVNTPIWNPRLPDREVPALLRAAGIGTLAFNGGGLTDLYHWRDGSMSPDPDAAHHPYDYSLLPPQITFDQFATAARRAHARTLVHVNYGTGTAQEAADWVRYANVEKHYGVRDWAIGEEVWGNGGITVNGFTINFEPDAHADKSGTAYGRNVVEYARAMKAADPAIRVGVELTGLQIPAMRQWDADVLTAAGSVIDFVDVHRFPYFQADKSDAALLQTARQIPELMSGLRSLVDEKSGGRHVDIVVGETNSAAVQAPQQVSTFNALFLADTELSVLDNGAVSVDWWALHNGGYATSGGGDLGLLSTGDCDDAGQNCGPPANTPFPTYYAQQIVGAVARPGGRLLPVTSANDLVIGHAVRQSNGTLAVVLINEDPDNAQPVTVDLAGYRAAPGATVLRYGRGDQAVVRQHENGDVRTRTLPPYSITTILLKPAA
jgi:alpha-L-arabinofuranosidase